MTGEANGNKSDENGLDKPKLLGNDPITGKPITLRRGPYGTYVQLGEEEEIDVEITRGKNKGGVKKKKIRPKRSSLYPGLDPYDLTLEAALGLLQLPREVGIDPNTGEMITAGIGRFGPYLSLHGMYLSLKDGDDPVTIGLNRAVTLFAESGKEPPKVIGDHPKDKAPVTLRKGRWGPFVQHGKTRANLPKNMEPDDLTLESAVTLLTEKGKTPGKKAPAKKKAAPKKKAT